MRISSKAAASAALVVLAGCGGGSGSDDGAADEAVPMATKADVLREVSLLGGIADELGYNIAPSAASTTRRSPLRLAARSHYQPQSQTRRKPAAVSGASPCDSGSVSTSSGSKTVSYSYYGASSPTDYEVDDYKDCVVDYSGDGYVDTDYDNGRIDMGYSTNDASEIQYGYGQFGSGGTPELYRNHYQLQGQPAEDNEVQTLGRVEFRSLQDGRFDQALVASFDYRENNRYSLSLDLGRSSAPFKLAEYGDGSLSLDGPYRYSSSLCSGGTASSTTNAPITFSAQTGDISGGEVRVSAGTNWAIVTFNPDGSAIYQLSNGGSGVIFSSEVDAALQTPQC